MINVVGVKFVGILVMVKIFDLDLEKIVNFIIERICVILINFFYNLIGKILFEKILENLGNLLIEVFKNYGKLIYLIFDEIFSCVVFNY